MGGPAAEGYRLLGGWSGFDSRHPPPPSVGPEQPGYLSYVAVRLWGCGRQRIGWEPENPPFQVGVRSCGKRCVTFGV